jgi:YVTN family beta-propeller protein
MLRLFTTFSVAALLLAAGAPPATAQSYHVTNTILLGGDGGWDYLTFDSASHRLFIARQSRIMVVNPDNGTVLGEIPGINGAHGVALAANGRGFATSGRDSSVVMFDLKTLAVEGRIPAGDDADAILYDPGTRRIYTFNGDAGTSTVIDPGTGKAVATIPLGGKPEFGVAAGDGILFVNIEDRAKVAEIDGAAGKVKRQWSLAPCESPTGLAIDRAHHLLFSGCRNQLMAVSDASSGRLLTTVPIGEGVDGCAFDPGTQLAFASNGDGTLTVIHEDSPRKFSVLANVDTRRGARTLALDEQSHRVFTVTAELGPAPEPTSEHPHPRPSIVPGTFALMTLEP